MLLRPALKASQAAWKGYRPRRSRHGTDRIASAEKSRSGVELEQHDVAVLDDVLLAFVAGLASFLGATSPPSVTKSLQAMVWARMKPRSKSVWMTPATWGASALVPVQARVSFGPAVK
jgi:hypothetical protein